MPGDSTALVERLSPRHKECLRLVFERQTSKEIAATLGLGVGTVDSYIAEAVALLGTRNRRRAAEMAFQHAAWADGEAAPRSLQPQNTGVPATTANAPSRQVDQQPSAWLKRLPFRSLGVQQNDLHPFRRLFWILQIAFAFAVSFGMLVTGLEVVARLLGGVM